MQVCCGQAPVPGTLAARLNRPQSFVAKYEGGERRTDVMEFMEIAEAIGFDPDKFIEELRTAVGRSCAAAEPGEAERKSGPARR